MILNPNQMKNILVFTDFSYSSFNAVRYAALLAHSFGESKIILYHSYALNPTSEGYLPYPVDLEALKAESLTKLQDLELAIQPFFSANTTLELQTDDHLLLASNNLSARIDLAVIGSKGQSNSDARNPGQAGQNPSGLNRQKYVDKKKWPQRSVTVKGSNSPSTATSRQGAAKF